MASKLGVVAAAAALGLGIGVGQGLMTPDRPTDIAAVGTSVAQQDAIARGAAEQTVIEVARRVTPAVVGISVPGAGSGSGVIVQREGVILTNAHVVGRAPQVEVSLASGERLVGTVLGRDPNNDVAVVRVSGRNLAAVPVGDSDRLQVGQAAIAIGNPLGLERSVTTGVVSAVNRSPRGIELGGLIQTDAAINPGNSGGPLLDSQGRVIGINTAIYQGTTGLGFAVPINLANDVARQLLTTGVIRRAYLGINYEDIEPEVAEYYGLPVRNGIYVVAIGRGSPAHQAGLQLGDIITRMGDVEIERGGDLRRVLTLRRPGETVPLTVVRGTRTTRLNVRLGEAPVQ
ncbi:MAG: trypsin-like peptidase domain-containing protein [Gemmatimonadota bacterium]|nr:trypsin-like peptidase domain-containing protein [Gemmatimonadota bacterium]